MRMRKKKHFDARWAAVAEDYLVAQPETRKGQWQGDFDALRVELGCGKGLYLTRQAVLAPSVLHVGVERNESVALLAMERARREGLTNALFIYGDVDRLTEWFAPGELDRLDIMFCDPWPELRRAKRRLTNRRYLSTFAPLCKENALFCFRTDNEGLFDFSLGELAHIAWPVERLTRDLHGEAPECGESMTGYEEKFVSLGQPIYQVKCRICKSSGTDCPPQ